MSAFTIDHHIVAGITLFGMLCDVVGALYLAYDLLGGRRGPLQTLTELVSISMILLVTAGLGAFAVMTAAGLLHLRILSVIGYQATLGWSLGLSFGAVPGIALSYWIILAKLRGITYQGIKQLAYWRRLLQAMPLSIFFGLEVSLTLFAGSRLSHDLGTGLIGGAIGGFFGGLILGSLSGRVLIRSLPPEDDPRPPTFEKAGPILGVLALTPTGLITALTYWFVYGPRDTAALIVSVFVGVLAAVVGGASGGTGIGIAQLLDWWVGQLPPRRLGAYGAGLILAGFVLQSVQYWLVELDIHVH